MPVLLGVIVTVFCNSTSCAFWGKVCLFSSDTCVPESKVFLKWTTHIPLGIPSWRKERDGEAERSSGVGRLAGMNQRELAQDTEQKSPAWEGDLYPGGKNGI